MSTPSGPPYKRPNYGSVARKEMPPYVPVSASKVLDVGCSSGAFGAALKANRKVEVWGVEPDQAAARRAAMALDAVVVSAFSIGVAVPNSYFDVVVFNDVLEHLSDPWAAPNLASTKLNAAGVVVASIPNLRHVDCLEHILIDADFRYEAHGVRDITHLRFFTMKSAKRLFEKSGFEVVTVEGINADWWSPSPWRRLALRLLGDRVDDMKYQQFAFVARPLNCDGLTRKTRSAARSANDADQ